MPFRVTNTTTGESAIHHSLKEAALNLGLSYNTLRHVRCGSRTGRSVKAPEYSALSFERVDRHGDVVSPAARVMPEEAAPETAE